MTQPDKLILDPFCSWLLHGHFLTPAIAASALRLEHLAFLFFSLPIIFLAEAFLHISVLSCCIRV